MEREQKIRDRFANKSMTFVVAWDCEVKKQLKEDKEMRKFFEMMQDTTPFKPRDTLYGGLLGFSLKF